MANELNQNTAFSEGVASLEKSLDTLLTDLRRAAHSAIDMDDWNKAEEILASTKADIKKIETLKKKFAEFKAEAVSLGFLSADAAKSPEAPKPEAKTVETPKPQPAPAAAEAPKPEAKPVEAPKPQPAPAPAEAPKPEAKPVEPPKPQPAPAAAEAPKPEAKPVETPKPQPAPATAEAPKPEAKPVEPVKPAPAPAPKPAEPPKPQPKPQPVSKPAANFDILDMDMSDDDDDKGVSDPIIAACEDLITKFPFSMRLIYSNPKIGKFFTTDEVIATNDMSKPKQLSNGLWVETNVPEEKIQTFIRSVMRYCDESVNM